jgi:hypothetical protein
LREKNKSKEKVINYQINILIGNIVDELDKKLSSIGAESQKFELFVRDIADSSSQRKLLTQDSDSNNIQLYAPLSCTLLSRNSVTPDYNSVEFELIKVFISLNLLNFIDEV